MRLATATVLALAWMLEAGAAYAQEPAEGVDASTEEVEADEPAEGNANEEAPEPSREDPAPVRRSIEPDADPPPSSASSALGIVTILSAVGTLVGVGLLVERSDNVSACEAYAAEDPPTRGCLNFPAIAEQRDVGIGLTIGFGALTIGAAIAWVIAATTGAAPEVAAFVCAPGVLSLSCAGRF